MTKLSAWHLRDELLILTQKWYVSALAFLLGSLAGLALALALPPAYRAEATLFVAINLDTHLTAEDDYKHWQLAQLEALFRTEAVRTQVLAALQAQDTRWAQATPAALDEMFSVEWRNAGVWTMVVTGPDPQMAADAVLLWRQIALQELEKVLPHAEAAYRMAEAHRAALALQTETGLRLQELQTWQEEAAAWTATLTTPDSTFSPDELAALQALAGKARLLLASYAGLLPPLPSPDEPPAAYLPFLEQAQQIASGESDILKARTSQLETEVQRLYEAWAEENRAAREISIYLEAKPLSEDARVVARRPAGTLALAGGTIGMLGWLVGSLVVVARKGTTDEGR